MEMTQTQPVYPKGFDFDQVWAALMENREQLKETAERQRETDRQLKENAREIREALRETARRQEETDQQLKENARQMKEYNKRFGEFTNRFGEVVEYMIAPNLQEKFRELDLNFPRANPNPVVSDYENDIFLEIDVMLENGDKAMLVEVKTKLTTEHINDHVKRLEKMRAYADLHGDKRTFLGAVAGVVMTNNVKRYALGQGFYAIEPSGETFNITPPDGRPKEW